MALCIHLQSAFFIVLINEEISTAVESDTLFRVAKESIQRKKPKGSVRYASKSPLESPFYYVRRHTMRTAAGYIAFFTYKTYDCL